MASIIRRLRRSNRKAAKFRFTVTLQELQLLTDETWKPETLVVSFVHRRRKISSKERKWEPSFSDQSKCVIVWPEQMRDSIDIVTTLYRSQDDDQYQDKEWTIIIEEITAKGKRRAIAAVPLNVRLFILDLPDHKSELKLKLRPLVPKLRQSSLILLLGSVLLTESITDDMSNTSSVMDRTVDEVDLGTPERILDTRRELESVVTQQKYPKAASIIFEEKRINEEVPPPVPVHRQSIESEKVRPIWRVSQEPSEENAGSLPKRQSRTSRASTEDSKTPSTIAVFEVDANSRPIPVNNTLNTGTIPRKRSHSPRAPSRDTVPQPIVGEGLLAWCQRITDGYTNLKVTDFTKSWRNGLALCAILHTYRPDLIGDYEQLDFSDRVDGRKSNIKKALVATRMMGLNDVPDENDFLTPDRKSIELLLQKIRRIFEGNFEDATPTSASDHRISNMFGISETEQKVVDMIKKMKEKQEEDNAVDYSDVKDEDDEQIKVSNNDGDFIIDDDTEISTFNFNRNEDSIIIATPGFTSIRSSGRHASPSKHDELRRRARDMLGKKASTLTTTPLNGRDNGENERFRDQARQLIDNATTDGTTFKIMASRNATPTTPIRHGSSTDLRRVEIVRANVDVHRFKKRDPSPTLVRKQYDPNETPHLPAISRSSNYGSRNRLDELLTSNPFDRVKRYGSMRSAELKESLQLLAKQYGYGAEEVLATPTKKFSSQWEKDVHDIEGTALEQEKIEQRLSDVEQQSKAIEAKIRDTEKGESEELMLLETFMRLTNEKNTLVGKQEYYNIIENIRQTTQQIDKFAKQLDDMTKNIDDDYQKSPEEKSETDKLMEDYRKALDQKSTLVQKLFATEEEMYDDEDRLKNLTLDRASRFVRGIDQPVSASKRLMQWWRR